MNLLDFDFNFLDLVTEGKWTKSDLKYISEEIKKINTDDLKTLYEDLVKKDKNLSRYNKELLMEIKKELNERGFTFNQFSETI